MMALLATPFLTACTDDENTGLGNLVDGEDQFGKANDVFSAAEWYPGGQLGTTDKASYSASTPAVGLIPGGNGEMDFTVGEDFFEHLYTFEQQPRKGLGPAWVRNSCIACHPSYGHGKRQTNYRANTIGNGYLLVIYHPSTNGYITEVTGMPQTAAMSPFKAPIDENQIDIKWKEVSSMESGLAMKFPDGESYSLIYPEVVPVCSMRLLMRTSRHSGARRLSMWNSTQPCGTRKLMPSRHRHTIVHLITILVRSMALTVR